MIIDVDVNQKICKISSKVQNQQSFIYQDQIIFSTLRIYHCKGWITNRAMSATPLGHRPQRLCLQSELPKIQTHCYTIYDCSTALYHFTFRNYLHHLHSEVWHPCAEFRFTCEIIISNNPEGISFYQWYLSHSLIHSTTETQSNHSQYNRFIIDWLVGPQKCFYNIDSHFLVVFFQSFLLMSDKEAAQEFNHIHGCYV